MLLSDTNLGHADRQWIEETLAPDETLQWTGKPIPSFLANGAWCAALFALIWFAMISQVTFTKAGQAPLAAQLFLIPFWCVGLILLSVPWWQHRCMKRTVYVLTDRRALVLSPSLTGKKKMKAYCLAPDMVKERKLRRDGSGDLVFDYEERRGKHGSRMVGVGFLRLPQLQQAEARLRQLLAQEKANSSLASATTSPEEAPSSRKSHPVLGTLLSLVLLALGGFFLHQDLQLVTDGIRTEGTVLRVQTERVGRKARHYPIIRFKDQTGRTHVVKSDLALTPSLWQPGEKLHLYYMPSNPNRMLIDSFVTIWLLPATLGGVGAALLVFSLWGLVRRKKGQQGQ